VLGAVLPDLPIVVLWAVATLVWRQPQQLTWSETYFRPAWQTAVDVPHALPVLAVALIATWLPVGRDTRTRAPRSAAWWRALLASMMLHAVADLLTHHDDAHRHLWPLSDWRLASPVSYWDPHHFGLWFAPLECAAALALLPVAWRRLHRRAARAVLAALGLAYAAGLALGVTRLAGGPIRAGSLQGAVTGRR
jgi:hypothetical protein